MAPLQVSAYGMPLHKLVRHPLSILHFSMKILNRHFEKDRSGYIRMTAEDGDDLWNVYNLVLPGDRVEASTLRRIQLESSSGEVDNSSRIRINLTIAIESISPDLESGIIHLNGKTVVENKYVKLGSYHTLDLELNHPFKVIKEYWDSVTLEMLKEASEIASKAEIAAVTLQEGLANIILMTQSTTSVMQKIEVNIPRKRLGSSTSHDKAFDRFFMQIYQAILRNVKLEHIKVIILASPGFLKDQLFEFIFSQALKDSNRPLLDVKTKFLLIHCSSGQNSALQEVMKDANVQSKLATTKFARQAKALDQFYSMLSNDPSRAYYGFKHVDMANEISAISTLLITDQLFRSNDVVIRKKYVELVESVKRNGGEVLLYSTSHVSGQQLQQLTGVAAILTYSVPEIEESDDTSDAK